ncbi:ead/Ea22-like family protein [Escherichia coli]|uniref:ead/Ea22-like family protein n=1 Tax=Escherichia coli TaxID=562 RepID=UPI0030C67699
MTALNKQALREAAIRAGGGNWIYIRTLSLSNAYITEETGVTVINCTAGDVPAKCAGFLELANPAAVLALLDELEDAENNLIDSECHVAGLEESLRDKQALLEALDNSLCELLPGTQYMDPPDGGSVTPLEQVRRMVAAYRNRIAELEARAVTLPQYRNSPDMHTKQFYEAIGFNQGLDIFIEALRAAGIGVKGE